jgi:hypothetical protein
LQKSPTKFVARYATAVLALMSLGTGACSPAADRPAETADPERTESGACGAGGTFHASLYGEIAADIGWSDRQYECRGMPRPDGQGARFFFAGHDEAGDRRLAFILAIPEFDRDAAGQELDSTLTLIEEGSGRFFSTATDANCATAIAGIEAIADDGTQVAVRGSVYCVSPLAEVNGDSSVSVAELRFAGVLDWNGS